MKQCLSCTPISNATMFIHTHNVWRMDVHDRDASLYVHPSALNMLHFLRKSPPFHAGILKTPLHFKEKI
jgi:hypothetical protein